jgi:hypothetical protein
MSVSGTKAVGGVVLSNRINPPMKKSRITNHRNNEFFVFFFFGVISVFFSERSVR